MWRDQFDNHYFGWLLLAPGMVNTTYWAASFWGYLAAGDSTMLGGEVRVQLVSQYDQLPRTRALEQAKEKRFEEMEI